ncbi:MAG: hypothetical protein KKB82_00790 [Candidatus Omnitrophica bacterium]|nr:hypothetical protein [Candidatus Omnitrophota bacterium]MBU1924438.1 hypothetical protein [Candidatus Omnitrophota bacterium]MBU2062823.1 hypothetical protein [Candidatus Omnitrophota bacterium]
MKKLKNILKNKELSIILFCLSLVLFVWPFLSSCHENPAMMFVYLFLAWGAIIVFLILMDTNSEKDSSG